MTSHPSITKLNERDDGLDVKITKPRQTQEGTKESALQQSLTAKLRESLRPKTFDDVPGAEIAEGLGLKDDRRISPLPEECKDWRFMTAKFQIEDGVDPRTKYEEIKSVAETFGGLVAAIPFSDGTKIELMFVFPNGISAKNAAIELQQLATIGIQRTRGVSTGIIHGNVIWPGPGIASAQTPIEIGNDQSHEFAPARLFGDKEVVPGEAMKKLKLVPSTLTSVGAVVEIRMSDFLKDIDPRERSAILSKILGLVEENTDRMQWLGDKLVILSTRERGAPILASKLKKILDNHPNLNIEVVISEGKINLRNLGEKNGSPRIPTSTAFSDTATAFTGKNRGVFAATKDEFSNLNLPRGLNIKSFKELEGGAIELIDFEERNMEIMTGGPREMLGRDEELRKFISVMSRLKYNPGFGAFALDGDPGIGKSRFLEEMIKYFKKHNIKFNVSKAEEDEKSRTYTFLKRTLGGFLGNFQKQRGSETYRVLNQFTNGGEQDEEITQKAEAMYNSPELLIKKLLELAGTEKNIYSMLLDDMQWCDMPSAIVIAGLIRNLKNSETVNKIFLGLSSRGDLEKIPPPIKQALEEIGVDSVHLGPLAFESKDELGRSSSTELIERYILLSLPINSMDGQVLPATFKNELAKRSAGNPFALTQMLTYLQNKGTLYVNDEGKVVVEENKIDYEELGLESLIQNRLARMTEDEQLVFKALVLFNGKIGRKLFERLFPELIGSAMNLEKESFISTQPTVKIAHDLIREAANRKFRPDPDLSWMIYGKVAALSGSAEFAGEIDDVVLFKLIAPMLEEKDGGERVGGTLYTNAAEHGVRAVQLLEGKRRTKEAMEMAKNVNDIPGMNDAQKLQLLASLARLNVSLGITSREEYEKANAMLEQALSLSTNPKQKLDLMVIYCDLCHLGRDGKKMRTVAGKLKASTDRAKTEGFSSLKKELQVKVLAWDGLAKLNLAKADYHDGQFDESIRQCREVFEEMGMGMGEIPLEMERVLLEAKRFFATTIMVKENNTRNKYDGDTIWKQQPSTGENRNFEIAKNALIAVLKAYRSDKPLLRNPKDLISAHEILAKLEIFTRGDRPEALRWLKEGAREAVNYGEVDMVANFERIIGDLYIAMAGREEPAGSAFEKAFIAYAKSLAELKTISPSEQHSYFKFTQCNSARATCLWLDSLEENSIVPIEKIRSRILEAWQNATKSFNASYGASGGNLTEMALQYVLPSIGHLKHYAKKFGVELDYKGHLFEVFGEDGMIIRNAEEIVSDKNEKLIAQMQTGPNEKCVQDELKWKLKGLKHISGIDTSDLEVDVIK